MTAATLQSQPVDTMSQRQSHPVVAVQSQPVDSSPSPVITVDAMSQRQPQPVDTVQSQPVDPSPSPVITVEAMSQRGGKAWNNALPSFQKVKRTIIDFFSSW